MAQERSSWNVRDSDIVVELIRLMDLQPEEQRLLLDLQTAARAVAPRLSTSFYDRLLRFDNTTEYFNNASVAHLHGTLQGWFIDLFRGVYDEEYAQSRLKVGHIHAIQGIPVRYPLAMMDVILEAGQEVTSTSNQPERAFQAFRKVLSLDVAIFNQAYEDRHLRHLAELVGGERLARVLLSGGG